MKRIGIIILAVLILTMGVSCTDKEAMRERLDYVSQCNRADTIFTEKWLPTVDSLVRYFDTHGNANERMMAHYLKGRVHHDMGEAPLALESYQRATEIADTTREDCDLRTLSSIYGQEAALFYLQYLPDDELNAIKMAEHFAWKNKDTLSAITAYRLRTGVYFHRNDTDSLLSITSRSVELYRQYGGDALAAQILILPISIYLNRGQYQKAWEDMQVYENESGFFDEKGNLLRGKELYFYYKGLFLLSQNQSDEAIEYFWKALAGGFYEAGYKGLLAAYEHKHIPDSIAKYARLFANANDDSYMGVEQEIVHQISAQYNFSHQQRLAEQQTIKLEKTRRNVLMMIVIALAMISALIIYHLYKKKKLEEHVNAMTRDFAQLSVELARQKEEAVNMERQYARLLEENELKENQTETASMIEIYKEALANKNAMIDALQVKVDEQTKTIMEYANLDRQQIFFDSDIYHLFDARRKFYKGYQVPSNSEWKELINLFSTHFTQYFIFVSKDDILSQDQLRLCVLLRLNFTESEMMLLMGRDYKQSINKIKTQVNEKLFRTNEASSLKDNLRPYF